VIRITVAERILKDTHMRMAFHPEFSLPSRAHLKGRPTPALPLLVTAGGPARAEATLADAKNFAAFNRLNVDPSDSRPNESCAGHVHDNMGAGAILDSSLHPAHDTRHDYLPRAALEVPVPDLSDRGIVTPGSGAFALRAAGPRQVRQRPVHRSSLRCGGAVD
jgi:hypothetical protein